MDCLWVTFTLNMNSCSYSDTVSAKDTNHRLSSYAMVFVILCLYALDTLSFAYDWSFYYWAFIDNGWNFWTVFLAFDSFTSEFKRRAWVINISGAISILVADSSMVCYFVITHWKWTAWIFLDLEMLDCLGTTLVNHPSAHDMSSNRNRYIQFKICFN